MESETVHERVASQFGSAAASYVHSPVHANADELGKLVATLNPRATEVALDVATGAGHMALALAPYVASVTAFDLTPEMLTQTLAGARSKGLENVVVVEGAAESLPFPDESFDIYTVRLAPHHFADIRATLREAKRVLRPGGRFLVVDTTAPEDDSLDQYLNEIEALRDPSHVRNYKTSDWVSMLTEASLEVAEVTEGRCGELEFEDWTRRQNVPLDRKEILRHKFSSATVGLSDLLELRSAGTTYLFTLPQVTILANRK